MLPVGLQLPPLKPVILLAQHFALFSCRAAVCCCLFEFMAPAHSKPAKADQKSKDKKKSAKKDTSKECSKVEKKSKAKDTQGEKAGKGEKIMAAVARASALKKGSSSPTSTTASSAPSHRVNFKQPVYVYGTPQGRGTAALSSPSAVPKETEIPKKSKEPENKEKQKKENKEKMEKKEKKEKQEKKEKKEKKIRRIRRTQTQRM